MRSRASSASRCRSETIHASRGERDGRERPRSALQIGPDGKLKNVLVGRSSGYELLDERAVELVRQIRCRTYPRHSARGSSPSPFRSLSRSRTPERDFLAPVHPPCPTRCSHRWNLMHPAGSKPVTGTASGTSSAETLQGAPVVFLHGGPGSSINSSHRRFFDPSFYRIVLFDQRGCGRSTPRGEINANTTQHLIEDLERLRDLLGIETLAVVRRELGQHAGARLRPGASRCGDRAGVARALPGLRRRGSLVSHRPAAFSAGSVERVRRRGGGFLGRWLAALLLRTFEDGRRCCGSALERVGIGSHGSGRSGVRRRVS